MAVAVMALAGLGIEGLGLLLHVIGLATPSWSVFESKGVDASYGLWKACANTECVTISSSAKKHYDGKYEAVEALAIIGMLAAIAAVVAATLNVFLPMLRQQVNAPLHLLSGCAAVFSFVCIIVGVIIWGAGIHDKYFSHLFDLGYSFVLCIVGGILLLFGGCVTIAGGRQTMTQM